MERNQAARYILPDAENHKAINDKLPFKNGS
jgi:hypothetical protein